MHDRHAAYLARDHERRGQKQEAGTDYSVRDVGLIREKRGKKREIETHTLRDRGMT